LNFGSSNQPVSRLVVEFCLLIETSVCRSSVEETHHPENICSPCFHNITVCWLKPLYFFYFYHQLSAVATYCLEARRNYEEGNEKLALFNGNRERKSPRLLISSRRENFPRQNAKSTRSARFGQSFALFVRFHVDCTTKSLTLQIYRNPVHWLVSRVHHYHFFTSALSE
jgi:hypothetical protein